MKYIKPWNEAKKITEYPSSNPDVKVKILFPKISNDKQDSFWYYDKYIAEVTDGIHTFEVRAQGSIDIAFEEDGGTFSDADAVKEAKKRKLKDSDIKKLGEDDLVQHNNWFLVEYYCEEKNDSYEVSIAATEYDEAIEIAIDAFSDLKCLTNISKMCPCDACKAWKEIGNFDIWKQYCKKLKSFKRFGL